MRPSSRKRSYAPSGVNGLEISLFSDDDISLIDPVARDVYQKAGSRPKDAELAIQAELMKGASPRKGRLRKLIAETYSEEMIPFFDYAIKRSHGTRRSGDKAILHEHATQVRVGRVFGPEIQKLAIAHDAVEDNSYSIVDIEYYLWEQGTRRFGFSNETTDSLRLLTNIHRIIMRNAEERMEMRDKSYAKKLLISSDVKEGDDVKESLRNFITTRRERLTRKQLYFDQPCLRDLETIIDIIDIEGLPASEAVHAIGDAAEAYASKKLESRTLRRELESQYEFIDQFVERPLLYRRFRQVLNRLNASKYSHIKAEQEGSKKEIQGSLLNILSSMEEAITLIEDEAGTEIVRGCKGKLARLHDKARKSTVLDEDDEKYILASAAKQFNKALLGIPGRIIDVGNLRPASGLYSNQQKEQDRLSFERAMGRECYMLDIMTINLADVAEQLVVRNQLMYLNALSPALTQKDLRRITAEDFAAETPKAIDAMREKYRPYFASLMQMIDDCSSNERFMEALKAKAYEHYLSDLVHAEKAHYDSGSRKLRGLMIVKMFDAIDNVRTAPTDSRSAIAKLIEKTLMIEVKARELEDYLSSSGAPEEMTGSIKGSRLLMLNELHASLVENARMQFSRRDNLFRAGQMIPYLLGEAKKLYDRRKEYLR